MFTSAVLRWGFHGAVLHWMSNGALTLQRHTLVQPAKLFLINYQISFIWWHLHSQTVKLKREAAFHRMQLDSILCPVPGVLWRTGIDADHRFLSVHLVSLFMKCNCSFCALLPIFVDCNSTDHKQRQNTRTVSLTDMKKKVGVFPSDSTDSGTAGISSYNQPAPKPDFSV